MPPEAYAAEAKEAIEKGYTSYKFKARPWWDVFAQVEAVVLFQPRRFQFGQPHQRIALR